MDPGRPCHGDDHAPWIGIPRTAGYPGGASRIEGAVLCCATGSRRTCGGLAGACAPETSALPRSPAARRIAAPCWRHSARAAAPSPDCAPPHTSLKRKRRWTRRLLRLRFKPVWNTRFLASPLRAQSRLAAPSACRGPGPVATQGQGPGCPRSAPARSGAAAPRGRRRAPDPGPGGPPRSAVRRDAPSWARASRGWPSRWSTWRGCAR
jgi:hypothetical protein